ncbi:Complexin-3 [Aix galericulata]|nr:Complexin-3 [Aix galericulata]
MEIFSRGGAGIRSCPHPSAASSRSRRPVPSTTTSPRLLLFQNETDDNQIQLVGGDVELPKELAKMIEQDNEEEEEKNSVIGQLSNIQNLDLDSLKDKASATLEDLKQSAEKCAVM